MLVLYGGRSTYSGRIASVSSPASPAGLPVIMPRVAASTTSTIFAESGLQRAGRPGALTPRTEGTRVWRGRVAVLPLTHSGVPELLFAISTASVGASRSAPIDRTGAAIERPLLVREQIPDSLARFTTPAAHDGTAPDPGRRYNGAGRLAEDALGRNGRPRHHLRQSLLFRCRCTTDLAVEQITRWCACAHLSPGETDSLPRNTLPL